MNISRTSLKAFTLTEILFVILIAGFVSLGLYQFGVDMSRSLFTSTEKNEIADDIRQFTGEMTSIARAANNAIIYPSFESNDRNSIGDRQNSGQSGDFALFVFIEPSTSGLTADKITRLVGYFRRPDSADPEGKGPVLKFDISYNPGKSTNDYTPEQLLSSLSYNDDYTNIVELSKGLADGKLFYNYHDKSVMIKAQIIHGNAAKRVTDTYNFTVSPRG